MISATSDKVLLLENPSLRNKTFLQWKLRVTSHSRLDTFVRIYPLFYSTSVKKNQNQQIFYALNTSYAIMSWWDLLDYHSFQESSQPGTLSLPPNLFPNQLSKANHKRAQSENELRGVAMNVRALLFCRSSLQLWLDQKTYNLFDHSEESLGGRLETLSEITRKRRRKKALKIH